MNQNANLWTRMQICLWRFQNDSFNDKEPEKFFLHILKAYNHNGVASRVLRALILSVMSCRAQEIYSALTVEQDVIFIYWNIFPQKHMIFYERHTDKFRNLKRHESHTYYEFANEKQSLFKLHNAKKFKDT